MNVPKSLRFEVDPRSVLEMKDCFIVIQFTQTYFLVHVHLVHCTSTVSFRGMETFVFGAEKSEKSKMEESCRWVVKRVLSSKLHSSK